MINLSYLRWAWHWKILITTPTSKFCLHCLCGEVTHACHYDVIKWKHFPRYLHFVRGIHRWPVSQAELWCFLWSSPEPTIEQTKKTQSRSLWHHCNGTRSHFSFIILNACKLLHGRWSYKMWRSGCRWGRGSTREKFEMTIFLHKM